MDVLAILAAVGAILGSFLLRLLGSEVQDWLPAIARWLIKRATRRLPTSVQQRHLEEWLADNNDYPGKLGKLLHALGCVLGASRIVGQINNSSGYQDARHGIERTQDKNDEKTRQPASFISNLEDIIEAAKLHDLGHPKFAHAGRSAKPEPVESRGRWLVEDEAKLLAEFVPKGYEECAIFASVDPNADYILLHSDGRATTCPSYFKVRDSLQKTSIRDITRVGSPTTPASRPPSPPARSRLT
jgi:hypothetical protein